MLMFLTTKLSWPNRLTKMLLNFKDEMSMEKIIVVPSCQCVRWYFVKHVHWDFWHYGIPPVILLIY